MKIVIVGGGKVGNAIASQLTREGHDIVLIDNNRQVVKRMSDTLDIMAIYGNGADIEVQREAGVENCDLLVAVTPKDELNMICCIIARKMGCKNTITRVGEPGYVKMMYFIKDDLGLSMTINPQWGAAREVFRLIQLPGVLKRDSFAKGRAEMVELEIRPRGVLDGARLSELAGKVKVKVLVCAVQRGGEVHIPSGNYVLRAGDKIYVIAPTTELIGLMSSLGLKTHKNKTTMIIGGGLITQYLTSMLLNTGSRVKIIEINEERARALAEIFPAAVVINADGSSKSVLAAQHIEQMDAVVTITNMDEENMLVSMYAKFVGVPQVITKLNRTEYSEVFYDKGIDCIVSPKQLCAQGVVSYARAMQNTAGSAVLAMHNLVEEKAEALEFNVTGSTKNLGKTLKDITLKPDILIGCINRMGQIIIPGGSDTLEVGDTVIVVTATGRIIVDLNDIFDEAKP